MKVHRFSSAWLAAFLRGSSARWVYVLLLLALGCGGSDEDDAELVDCSWFETEQNCWRAGVREANACFAVDESTAGNFNSDRDECTYADGRNVQFADAVPFPIPDEYPWNFEARSAAGQSCVRFRETGQGFELHTASGMSMQTNLGTDPVTVCPDGARYRLPLATAFECLGSLPGITWSSSGAFLSVAILGGGEDASQFVDCEVP